MNDSRLDAGLRPGISTFPIKHQILTTRLSLQSVFRFCRQIYTQPQRDHGPAVRMHDRTGQHLMVVGDRAVAVTPLAAVLAAHGSRCKKARAVQRQQIVVAIHRIRLQHLASLQFAE